MTVGGRFEESLKTRRAALGRCGLSRVSAVPAVAGCVDVLDGGGCVTSRSVRCAAEESILSVDRCTSTGSPVKSPFHSPGPPSRHHPLKDTDMAEQICELALT